MVLKKSIISTILRLFFGLDTVLDAEDKKKTQQSLLLKN